MRAVIQRVENARLTVNDQEISKINKGLVCFFCVEKGDLEEKVHFFAKKIANLRLFADNFDKTNLSVKDIGGEVLLVSQFTLAGDCNNGNRPSFSTAELPERAHELYLKLANEIETEYGVPVKLGAFGKHMIIEQTNLGPFTVFVEK